MLKLEAFWPTVAQLIRSEQVPASRLAEISRLYPAFAAWFTKSGNIVP